jgi:hypothetical protein
LDARWAKHVEHALGKRTNGVLYAALRKYGPETFHREVIAECDDWDRLCQMEQESIQSQRTQSPYGYNVTPGGEGVLGPRNEQAKAAISKAQQQRYSDPDQKARLREYGLRGNAIRAKAAQINQEQKALEHRAYLATGEPQRKHAASVRSALARPEVRAKILACAQERAASPDWRSKISASKTGQRLGPCSESRKQKIAEARRREWADPVIRAVRLAGLAKARAAKEIHGNG